MRNLLVIFALVFAVVGCTKEEAKVVLCETGKTAASLLSAQVAVQLECKNIDAIKADIEKKLVDLKVCEAPAPAPTGALSTKSVIGDALCKPVVEGLIAGLLTQVPAAWECTGGKLTDDAKLKLFEACAKAL